MVSCSLRALKELKKYKKTRDLTTSHIPPGHAAFLGGGTIFGTWGPVADVITFDKNFYDIASPTHNSH